MTTKHTPPPWQSRESYSKGEPQGPVIYAGREIIAEIPGTSPHDFANARIIAHAVNNFAPMLAALEKAEQGARQLCETVNNLSRQLGLGVKVREEDFADYIRAAVRAAKEGA